jgi:WD40 repeat protein
LLRKTLFPFSLLVCLVFGCVVASAQDCQPPAITANSKNYNIFTPEQEMMLGELVYQQMAGETRYIQDEKLLAYVREIGNRLVRHLPPTGLKFQFFIVDIPSANAFNTPGGYVFLSRKLVAFTKNEDELAGVMAHELGHATVRHAASDMSELFKKILNITQLGDRRDITDKFNLLLERERTKRISQSSGHESAQQLEADRIGLFAMVAAGYDPNAFSEFFARLTEAKANSGNWFTSIFGGSSPTEKRLREMIKATEQLPATCRDNRNTSASQQYLSWQADVVSFRQSQIAEELPGLLWKKELTPQLKSDIWHFAFTNDGKYFLAQDDFAVSVVQRDPVKVVFQIPTTDARPASFTPDGQFVIFGTESLRFEKWSIAEAKPVEVRELVVRRDCMEQEFSPDGKYLACVDYDFGFTVMETQTGKRVFQKKQFATLNVFEYLLWIAGMIQGDDSSHSNTFFNFQFSPDSRYLVAARSTRYRFRITVDNMPLDQSGEALVALDLTTLKPLSASGDLKKALRRPFIFLSPDKVLGGTWGTDDGGIFTFPQGKRIASFKLNAPEMKLAANPNYVVVKLRNEMVNFFDLSSGQFIGGFNKPTLALWNDVIVSEMASGNVAIATAKFNAEQKSLTTIPLGTVDIPVGSMNRIYAANLSDNMQWLAISSKTRGAIWDLNTGERKLHVRGFRGALVAANGTAIGDFPRMEPVNHSLVLLDASKQQINVLREIPERGARQYGRFVLVRTSLKTLRENENKRDKDKDLSALFGSDAGETLSREVRFELRDVVNDKVIWSKDFPKEAPGYFFDAYSGRVIFYWNLGSEAGKARLKEDPALVERSRQMGNKDDDYVLEVFDAFQNKSAGVLLLETGKGSFDIEEGFSEGNWLVLHDDNNRILVYSIKEGELRHRFFGANAAMSPQGTHIIVENYPGELTLYDLATGNSQGRLRFKTGATFARFSLDGKRLLVLTAGQVAYAFDTTRLAAK